MQLLSTISSPQNFVYVPQASDCSVSKKFLNIIVLLIESYNYRINVPNVMCDTCDFLSIYIAGGHITGENISSVKPKFPYKSNLNQAYDHWFFKIGFVYKVGVCTP